MGVGNASVSFLLTKLLRSVSANLSTGAASLSWRWLRLGVHAKAVTGRTTPRIERWR